MTSVAVPKELMKESFQTFNILENCLELNVGMLYCTVFTVRFFYIFKSIVDSAGSLTRTWSLSLYEILTGE